MWSREFIRLALFTLPILMAGTHFTKGLWAHDSNLVMIHFDFTWTKMISCHYFPHAVTTKRLWHGPIFHMRLIRIKVKAKIILRNLNDKLIVKSVPGNIAPRRIPLTFTTRKSINKWSCSYKSNVTWSVKQTMWPQTAEKYLVCWITNYIIIQHSDWKQ